MDDLGNISARARVYGDEAVLCEASFIHRCSEVTSMLRNPDMGPRAADTSFPRLANLAQRARFRLAGDGPLRPRARAFFCPPVASKEECWRRANCGIGSTRPGGADLVPFLECVDEEGYYYPMDTHADLEFVEFQGFVDVPVLDSFMDRMLREDNIARLGTLTGMAPLDCVYQRLQCEDERATVAGDGTCGVMLSVVCGCMAAVIRAVEPHIQGYEVHLMDAHTRRSVPLDRDRGALKSGPLSAPGRPAPMDPQEGRAARMIRYGAAVIALENMQACEEGAWVGFCAADLLTEGDDARRFPVCLVLVRRRVLDLFRSSFPAWGSTTLPYKMWKYLHRRCKDAHSRDRLPFQYAPPVTLAAAALSPALLPAEDVPSDGACMVCGADPGPAAKFCTGCMTARVCKKEACLRGHAQAHPGHARVCRALRYRVVPAQLMADLFPACWRDQQLQDGDFVVLDWTRGAHRPLPAAALPVLRAALRAAVLQALPFDDPENVIPRMYTVPSLLPSEFSTDELGAAIFLRDH